MVELLRPVIYRDRAALVPGRLHQKWSEQQTLRRLLSRLKMIAYSMGVRTSANTAVNYEASVTQRKSLPLSQSPNALKPSPIALEGTGIGIA
jgi:hypothetical protein